MPRYLFEPLLIPIDEDASDMSPERPSWIWILHNVIEPICAEYQLILEYEHEDDESCALFYVE